MSNEKKFDLLLFVVDPKEFFRPFYHQLVLNTFIDFFLENKFHTNNIFR
jgi:hypothetical protein